MGTLLCQKLSVGRKGLKLGDKLAHVRKAKPLEDFPAFLLAKALMEKICRYTQPVLLPDLSVSHTI